MRINFVFKILPDLYYGLKGLNALGKRTPLFALPLAEGVAFAENPPDPRDSFGMSRSKLIAKQIVDLAERDAPKGSWFDEIERGLANEGFDLQAFYRNPGSQTYYDLPLGIVQA